ncbi:phenylalanine--tRNA ligase subunit alpha [Patescibacteria group bacterium]|nr:phenylalanine--tRNA ligase subunit alpha [Patescibacteria group bacterium]
MAEKRISLKKLRNQAEKNIREAQNLKDLDEVFRSYVGKKGKLTFILRSVSKLSEKEKIKRGREANELRDWLLKEFEKKQLVLQRKEIEEEEKKEWIDVTAPGTRIQEGHLHPLTHVQRQAQEIFQGMGFSVVQGPEIETEYYNFDALNIPKDHPARDLWDTFWLKNSKLLLRTHTSPVQIRYMESHQPPLRIIVPGRVFRYEATDANHEFDIMQLEGLLVGRDISVANFRAVIQEFYKRFFNKPVQIRLRPSYFPFVEPGFEVDMRWKQGLPGQGEWMEMMGAGMVHPNVFGAVGYNPKNWQGFAFGMGLDRLAMMKYKIDDVRLLRLSDLRFLQQF